MVGASYRVARQVLQQLLRQVAWQVHCDPMQSLQPHLLVGLFTCSSHESQKCNGIN